MISGQLSEVAHTADVLEGEFNLPVEGFEAKSRDTVENAGLTVRRVKLPDISKLFALILSIWIGCTCHLNGGASQSVPSRRLGPRKLFKTLDQANSYPRWRVI